MYGIRFLGSQALAGIVPFEKRGVLSHSVVDNSDTSRGDIDLVVHPSATYTMYIDKQKSIVLPLALLVGLHDVLLPGEVRRWLNIVCVKANSLATIA